MTYKGINASEGIGIGTIINYTKVVLSKIDGQAPSISDEMTLYNTSKDQSRQDLQVLMAHANETMGDEEAEIFQAHIMMLDDPEIHKGVVEAINNGAYAVNAIQDVMGRFATIFENLDNDYMRERAADVRDIMYRTTCHALGINLVDLTRLPDQTVLLADDLMPSETAQLDPSKVVGFITRTGGKTSHAAIMARTLRIPAVVGVSPIELKDGTPVIINGHDGYILEEPSSDQLLSYKNRQKDDLAFLESIAGLSKEQSYSSNGVRVELAANIGNVSDAINATEVGAEGVGLFRTEFLFMDRKTPPSEEEQYQAYKGSLQAYPTDKVVIRTLDIGGDKHIDYMDFPEEMNPFLGFRAIRYCLKNETIFRTQLRALLRASVHGQLAIMFPMISTLEELRLSKVMLEEEKVKLINEGLAVNETIDVGMMMEVPSAAVMAHAFGPEVDFFSIGTNDLTQYIMASDRMNANLEYLYTPMQPAVIMLIYNIVNAAKSNDIWIGMCGEAAGDPLLMPLWVAMGFDELSMSASSILKTRHLLKTLDTDLLDTFLHDVLMQTTVEDVKTCLENR